MLISDPEFSRQILALYNALPKDNLSKWQYKMNNISELRPFIDKISEHYISKYHSNNFDELKLLLNKQDNIYRRAYGKSKNFISPYSKEKIDDLKYRLGNAILKELKEYHKGILKKEIENFSLDSLSLDDITFDDSPSLFEEYGAENTIDNDFFQSVNIDTSKCSH